MRKGDIVRKRFAGNVPIGDYAVVNRSKGSFAEITYVSSPEMPLCISKNKLKVMKKASLIISDSLFEKLNEGKTFIISHETSAKWMKVYNMGPDIIRVYTPYGKEATYIVMAFNLISTIHGSRRIQIELGRRLL